MLETVSPITTSNELFSKGEWKNILPEILKLIGNLNGSKKNATLALTKIEEFSNELKNGKYSDLTKVEIHGIDLWLDSFKKYILKIYFT